jgi:hypothetical protein
MPRHSPGLEAYHRNRPRGADLTSRLPGKATPGAATGDLQGRVPHGQHPTYPAKKVENMKPSPMHAGYVCRVSGPQTEEVTRGATGDFAG